MGSAFRQFEESAPLKEVIIGRYKGYLQSPEYQEVVNEDQKQGFPDEANLETEFTAFRSALESEGVTVHEPAYVGKLVYDQLTPRDIGVTIGGRFLLCNMARRSRRYEVAGIFPYIMDRVGAEPNLIIPDDPAALMEGGDLMVDKGRLLVGISQRTNMKGLGFLQETFGHELEVVPVYCRSLAEGENVLHLDCTFNPIGEQHCLIYPDGFREVPEAIEKDYQWIEVNKEEQAVLATNVLSLSPQVVISRAHPLCERVNQEMEQIGLKVIRLPFDGAPATGGSFRCCSLPLYRS